MRAGLARVAAEASDATTRPFVDDVEPTRTDSARYAWLDETTQLGAPSIGTLDLADLVDVADATVDQPLDLATQPPPTTRSPS